MVKEALMQQLEAGLIRRSTSEWASPLHVVIKPDGTIRLTVDYKILNAAIEFDAYPMPNTHKLLQEITQSKWFSKFDFLKAYHQIPVERKSIKYTAFICDKAVQIIAVHATTNEPNTYEAHRQTQQLDPDIQFIKNFWRTNMRSLKM